MSSISKRIRTSAMVCSLLASSVFLSSCGGGGAAALAGIGGTGIVFGPIVAFGSVWVNGQRYEIDTSEISVDGDDVVGEAGLKLGMMVKLEVETENGVFTNKATRVIYDDEVEGPLTSIVPDDPLNPTLKTGQIFGQSVTFSDTTTVYVGTSFDNLGSEDDALADDVVEISGFRNATGMISATYVEFKGDLVAGSSEVELRGTISGYSGGSTFTVDGTTINIVGGTIFETPGNVPDNGLYVEVEGIYKTGGSVDANTVEAEDEDFADDVDDISVQGIVSGFATGGISNFKVGSQRVDASGLSPAPALADGMKIEVEGEIVGGVLFVDEFELRDEDSKLRSFIGSVNVTGGTFEVVYAAAAGTVTVHVDGNTLFEDDATGLINTLPFSLDDLEANVDFVRVEGIEFDDPGTPNEDVRATYVRRTDPDSSLKLEGQVDGYAQDSFVTVLGVTFDLDGLTSYDPDPPTFGTGDFVEIEDDRSPLPADGVADSVEQEF